MRSREISDRKRFYLYMAYVWSWAFLMTFIAYIFDASDDVPEYLKPQLGGPRCYLKGMLSYRLCHIGNLKNN